VDAGYLVDVTGGLLLRQAHHWAALMLPGSVALQLLSTFFTGAFRRPRQWAWVLLVAMKHNSKKGRRDEQRCC
jgi:ubiquinol-cytochrome c reductase cytochrome b subunit